MGVKVISLIKQSQESLAEDLSYLGYGRNMQSMIKNIFVKHDTQDYSGYDMSKFKSNLIDKLEDYDNKEMLTQIESIYLNLKKII